MKTNNTYEKNCIKDIYIFDIDGTLTPSGEAMDIQFTRWFENWMHKIDLYICTSNTYSKVKENLSRKIVDHAKACFTCNGNSIWIKNKELLSLKWHPPVDLISLLDAEVKSSSFKIRAGANIEHRTGMISFSILGKGAAAQDRERYRLHDKSLKERSNIISKIRSNFPEVFACLGGETSIDICEKGKDKSQILPYFNQYARSRHRLNFIGNDFSQFGGDKPLADAINTNYIGRYNIYKSSSWKDTFSYLRQLAI